MSCRPIGLFDSGVGGLSVLRELSRQLPQENVIYFADTFHMPYGPRSAAELQKLVYAILHFLQEYNVKLVIMACNTSSALVLESARQEFPFPLVGMIQPIAKSLAASSIRRLGVLATEATVRSDKYAQEFRQAGFTGEVYSCACPALASLVEEGAGLDHLEGVLTECVAPLRQAQVESVVLGCTHYPFVAESINRVLGGCIPLLNPASYAVAQAKSLLTARHLLRSATSAPRETLFVSGDILTFERRAGQLLGRQIVATQVGFSRQEGYFTHIY